jgi:hypothetical protein
MNKTILVSIISGVLALILGFFGGTYYQKNARTNQRTGTFPTGTFNGTRSQNGTGANRAIGNRNGVPISGKIINMDNTSITVQGADGSNKIILLSDQTKINKTSDGTKDDIKVGIDVMVIGNTTNGAVTAQSISLGTNFMRQSTSPTPTSSVK